MTGPRRSADKAELARQAIEYLLQTDLTLKWDFSEAEPPSEEIRQLLATYFVDGEIEVTTSLLLSDYLVSRLREDYPSADHARSSRPPVCRVVCGDEE